jgi:transcriptional regulator with XRE-family HTH domain
VRAAGELEAFGRRVRDRRQRLGLSARALAAKAGISPAYVTAIELGRNPSTGRPPVPSIQVIRGLAAALDLDLSHVLDELGASAAPADREHVLLYCLDRPPRGVLDIVERLFGSEVDHWLCIADPRDRQLADLGDRATVVRWELGAFPYQTRHLDPEALVAALNTGVRSLAMTHAGRRVGLAIADCSAVMRWVQNADAEVALERTWHKHVREAWKQHLGTDAAIDVCIYFHDDMHALALTIDQVATALALINDHQRVFVLDRGEAIVGSPAISRILQRAQPAGVSPTAWTDLTAAAAETLATRRLTTAS